MSAFDDALAAVGELDRDAEAAAAEHHDRLTKPRGSLGQLETVGIRLAAIAGEVPPPIPRPAAVAVFAADHGVATRREGRVTPWPQEVTAQMVANFVAGGAAINVLARQTGATVTVIDVGVASDLVELESAPGLRCRKVRAGTADLSVEPAMTLDDVDAALAIGAELARELADRGANALVTGDMGIGNTTASAAVIAALTGRAVAEVTGRGTGIDDDMLEYKIALIERALTRVATDADARTVLAEVGGLEIAALAGFIIGGAARRLPVVVDGVISNAALLAGASLCPRVVDFVFAGHRSSEPGATAVLRHLELEPLLDLHMRLGEGSGACLALPILEASARVLAEMATFDSAGVTDKDIDAI